jgi:hypothetical protein
MKGSIVILAMAVCVAMLACVPVDHPVVGPNTAQAGDSPSNEAVGPTTQTSTGKGWNIGQIAVAGSGWPLAAVVVIVGLMMLRARKQAVTGIAQAVQDMGPGRQRDALLTNIKTNLAKVPAAQQYLKTTVNNANLDVNKQPDSMQKP